MRNIMKKAAAFALAMVVAFAAVPAETQAAASKSIAKAKWEGYFGANDMSFFEGASGTLNSSSKTGWSATMDQIGWGGVWGCQMTNRNLSYKKGQTYEISFTLKSSNCDKWVLFKLEGEDAKAYNPDNAALMYQWIYLKEGQTKNCKYTYTFDKKYKGHVSVVFGIGGEQGDREDELAEGLYNGLSSLPSDGDPSLSTTVTCSKFSMKPVDTTIKSVKSPKAKTAKVTVKKATGIKGYVIQYSTKSNFSGAKKVKSTKATVTIKKLQSGKKYYFRVKTYNKNNVLSDTWSVKKSVKVK